MFLNVTNKIQPQKQVFVTPDESSILYDFAPWSFGPWTSNKIYTRLHCFWVNMLSCFKNKNKLEFDHLKQGLIKAMNCVDLQHRIFELCQAGSLKQKVEQHGENLLTRRMTDNTYCTRHTHPLPLDIAKPKKDKPQAQAAALNKCTEAHNRAPRKKRLCRLPSNVFISGIQEDSFSNRGLCQNNNNSNNKNINYCKHLKPTYYILALFLTTLHSITISTRNLRVGTIIIIPTSQIRKQACKN